MPTNPDPARTKPAAKKKRPAKAQAKTPPPPPAKPTAAEPAGAADKPKAEKPPTYPKRLHPPPRVKAAWARRGKVIGDRGYTQRWAAFWKRVVLALRERESWRDIDVDLVAEYVRRCRLVELHVDEAELDPYPENPDSGFKRPHGGWERSLAEAREARAIAIELKLTPRARHAAGIDIPPAGHNAGTGTGGRPAGDVDYYGETAGWVDDQTGPDGSPL